jgi:hypothetical protein
LAQQGNRSVKNLAASLNSNKALKDVPNNKRQRSPAKKTKEQEAPPVTEHPDETMSDFLLLQEAAASGSAPGISAVTLASTVVHGAPPAAGSADSTTTAIKVGGTPAEVPLNGRRQSSRLATTTGKSGGGNETQGSSSVSHNPEDEDDIEDENADDEEWRGNKTAEGRTPTKPFVVAEKRGRGRPFKSPTQQGFPATSHIPFPNPNPFFLPNDVGLRAFKSPVSDSGDGSDQGY